MSVFNWLGLLAFVWNLGAFAISVMGRLAALREHGEFGLMFSDQINTRAVFYAAAGLIVWLTA